MNKRRGHTRPQEPDRVSFIACDSHLSALLACGSYLPALARCLAQRALEHVYKCLTCRTNMGEEQPSLALFCVLDSLLLPPETIRPMHLRRNMPKWNTQHHV